MAHVSQPGGPSAPTCAGQQGLPRPVLLLCARARGQAAPCPLPGPRPAPYGTRRAQARVPSLGRCALSSGGRVPSLSRVETVGPRGPLLVPDRHLPPSPGTLPCVGPGWLWAPHFQSQVYPLLSCDRHCFPGAAGINDHELGGLKQPKGQKSPRCGWLGTGGSRGVSFASPGSWLRPPASASVPSGPPPPTGPRHGRLPLNSSPTASARTPLPHHGKGPGDVWGHCSPAAATPGATPGSHTSLSSGTRMEPTPSPVLPSPLVPVLASAGLAQADQRAACGSLRSSQEISRELVTASSGR